MKKFIGLFLFLSSCVSSQTNQNSFALDSYQEREPGLVSVVTKNDVVTRCHRYSVFGLGKCENKKCVAYLKNALNQNSTATINDENKSTLVGTSVVVCQKYRKESDGSLTKLEFFQKCNNEDKAYND